MVCAAPREMGNTQREKPFGAGMSSFELVDLEKLISELRLRKGITFLDLGCGRGEYAIAVSGTVGNDGLVYAVDLWEEGVASLQEEISARGIKNLHAMVADVAKKVPVEENSVDICFMAASFHDLVLANAAERAIKEVVRMLKQDGSLAILEFKKIDGPPGPPLSSRLAPEEVEEKVTPHGFNKARIRATGAYTYLITFHMG
jgi:ubiquinone/menaquinone biosynthesis C-methylase UbiE